MREEDHDNPLDLNNLPEDFSSWREAGKQIVDENFTSGCSSTNISSSTNTSSRKKEKGSSSSRSSEGGEGEYADENDKVYECRFCSLKFCKSQALGGHMNRHRQERETETLNKARQLVYGNDNLAAFAPPLAAPPSLPPHSHTHLGAHHIPLGGGSVINHHHQQQQQHQHPHQAQGMGVASAPHIYQTTRMFHPPPPPPPSAAAAPSSSSNFLTPRPTGVPPPQQPYVYGTTQLHHPLTSSYAPPHSYSPPLPHHHHHHDSYFVGRMTTHHIPSTTAHPPGSSNNSSNSSSVNREANLHYHQSAAASSYTCFGAPVGLSLPPPAGSTLIPNRGVYNVADATLLGQEEGSSGWTQRQHLDSSSPINIKSRFQDGI